MEHIASLQEFDSCLDQCHDQSHKNSLLRSQRNFAEILLLYHEQKRFINIRLFFSQSERRR